MKAAPPSSPRSAAIAVVLFAAGLLVATGAARADTVVLESHVATRDKSFAPLLGPVFDELAQREARSGYEAVGRAFERAASTPPATAAGVPADFAARADAGYRMWLEGKFKEALAALVPLVELAHRNPGAIANDGKLSTAVFKALVAISLCHQRLGDDTSAFATMAELARSFELEVTKGQYGSEAYELFQRTRRAAREQGTGTLVVRSRDEAAAIIINERIIKIGELERTEALPGRYRVLAQHGKDLGRIITIEVKPRERAEVVLDPEFERTVVTTPEWTGLLFRDRAEREQREVEHAARFGAAVGASGVIVLGTDLRNQRLVAYGALVNAATGKEVRRASVVIDTLPPPARLRSLARFLTGDEPNDDIEVYQPEAKPDEVVASGEPSAGRRARGDRWSGWRWLATGGAVAGVGAGIGLYLLDGNCAGSQSGSVCLDVYDTKTAGMLAGGTGLALGAVATWLWLSRDAEPGRERTAQGPLVAPTRGGAMVGWSWAR